MKVASTCVSGLLTAINKVNPNITANKNKLRGVKYNTISPKGTVPNKFPPSVLKSIFTYSLFISSLISTPIKPTFEATFNNNPQAAKNKLNNHNLGIIKNNANPIIHKHQAIPETPPSPSKVKTGKPLAFLEIAYNKIPPPATAPPVNPVKTISY